MAHAQGCSLPKRKDCANVARPSARDAGEEKDTAHAVAVSLGRRNHLELAASRGRQTLRKQHEACGRPATLPNACQSLGASSQRQFHATAPPRQVSDSEEYLA